MASRTGGAVFGALGPLEVWVHSRAVGLGSAQVRSVLAALLVDANVVVSTDQLVEVLWGDEPPRSAPSSVQKLVYRLRSLLGPEAGDVLATRTPGYVLRVDSESYDAARFENLVSEARIALGGQDPAGAAARLEEALGLWRGPAFAEFASAEFARAEAARLEELRWVATEERVEARLALGAHEELVGELEVLVDAAPFRERFWGELMLALYRSGRQAEALRAYGRLRALLGEELGIEPGEALRRLERAMLLQDPELEWPGFAPRGPPLPSEGAGGPPRGNLPLQLNSFVGRDRELAALVEALGESRLLTLTGVGGVGKTRLAVQAASRMLPGLRDGAWLCELAVAGDPDAMLQVVAVTLGVQARSGLSIEESVREFLRSKNLLLVLDNCEHLLDAAARFADAVLRESPDVCILATSREGLAVDAERIWALRSLPVPEPSAGVDDVVRSDAARLFADRAGAVQSDFVLDTSTASAVGELCRRLDGVPLAIELAAARAVAMTPDEIVALLDERFRLLTGGRRTAVERHQTLRATVEWSYSLLSPTEQLVFSRLGVFPGTFEAGAAEAVAAGAGVEGWGVVDALGSLVAKSMLVADSPATGTTRYSMLETLRAYARERLNEGEDADSWRRRHAEHYAAFAERAGPLLRGPDELAWRRQVRAELDNLRAAFAWSLDSAIADGQLGLRIVAALAHEALLDMASGVGIWATRAVARVGDAPSGRRSAILGAAALQAMYAADYETSETLALDALRAGHPTDGPGTAPAYTALAVAELVKGRPDESLRLRRRELEELGTGADDFRRSLVHSGASLHATYCGDGATARAEADEALRLARRIGNPSATAFALNSTGVALNRADPAAALAAFEAYIVLARAGAGSANFGIALGDVSLLRARAGDRVGALTAALEGIRYCDHTGNHATFGGTLSRTRHTLVQLGMWEQAAVVIGVLTEGPLAASDGQAGVAAERRDREQALQKTRAALGPDAFEEVLARGAAMTYDEVADYTLAELDRALVEARSL